MRGKGNASLRTLLSKRPSASMSSVIFSPAVSSGNKTPNPLRVGASFDPRENKLNNCWQCWKHNAHHWWLITTADGGDSALWERRRVYTGTKKQQVHCRACFWPYDGTYLRYSESQRAGWASRDQRWCIIPCGAPVKRQESWLCFNWVAHVPPMCR